MKSIDKKALFKNYVETALHVFKEFDALFTHKSIFSSLVGLESEDRHKRSDEEVLAIAEEHMKGTKAWTALSEMYDYAIHAIAPKVWEDRDAMTHSIEVSHFLQLEVDPMGGEWGYVLSKAYARYTLDNGLELTVDQLAELAEVDVRTVRNAISAGELTAEKRDGNVYLNNKSARNWLVDRRGFKPTFEASSNVKELKGVTKAWEFGSILIAARGNLEGWGHSEIESIAGVKRSDIQKLENGVFNISLDKVFPLADAYGFDRTIFLKSIMETFFPDEYTALTQNEEDENEKQV